MIPDVAVCGSSRQNACGRVERKPCRKRRSAKGQGVSGIHVGSGQIADHGAVGVFGHGEVIQADGRGAAFVLAIIPCDEHPLFRLPHHADPASTPLFPDNPA